ncbi:MAG TPA: CBS domain-containing protein [Candidatus Kryptonia bacterium]|nr:CBS domain-containing protein [Candidatus Kryptonia bacterium]
MHRFLEARVADYMTARVVSVAPETTLDALEDHFARYDFNGLPVLAGSALVGMVTKFDLLRAFIFTPQSVIPAYEELIKLTAHDIMTSDVISFPAETPLTRVLQALVDVRVKSFPVIDNDRLVGIIAREDVVRALRDAREGRKSVKA